MSTPHIKAENGDFAKTVIMPGDPLRAKFISDNFLKNSRLVTDVRNMFGYTGEYQNKRVSVMASGMGMPSMGIYSYELYTEFDVENIIRIGTAGSYSEDIKVKDVVLVDSVYSNSSFLKVFCGLEDEVIYPSDILNKKIKNIANELNIKLYNGRAYSTDVFYANVEGIDFNYYKNEKECVCVEMESFGLLSVAKFLHKNASCLLTISDSFVTNEITSSDERQTSFTKMMEIALKTATSEE